MISYKPGNWREVRVKIKGDPNRTEWTYQLMFPFAIILWCVGVPLFVGAFLVATVFAALAALLVAVDFGIRWIVYGIGWFMVRGSDAFGALVAAIVVPFD